MTITVNKKVETTEAKEIPVPSFWKDGKELIGFLNETTVAKVFLIDNYASIVNGTPKEMDHITANIEIYKPTTEAEFMSAYSEAYEAMRLEPKMGVYTSDILNNGHED